MTRSDIIAICALVISVVTAALSAWLSSWFGERSSRRVWEEQYARLRGDAEVDAAREQIRAKARELAVPVSKTADILTRRKLSAPIRTVWLLASEIDPAWRELLLLVDDTLADRLRTLHSAATYHGGDMQQEDAAEHMRELADALERLARL